jgi:hypothetical protein
VDPYNTTSYYRSDLFFHKMEDVQLYTRNETPNLIGIESGQVRP